MDQLKGYENVGHVLNVLSEMHEEIAKALSELSEQTRDERRTMTLDYLAAEQTKRAASLLVFQRDAEPMLLEQWLQIPFPEAPLDLIASLRAQESGSASIDALISEMDTFIGELLSHLRDRAETSNAKALFEDLLYIDNRERQLRSRGLASFAQV